MAEYQGVVPERPMVGTFATASDGSRVLRPAHADDTIQVPGLMVDGVTRVLTVTLTEDPCEAKISDSPLEKSDGWFVVGVIS